MNTNDKNNVREGWKTAVQRIKVLTPTGWKPLNSCTPQELEYVRSRTASEG